MLLFLSKHNLSRVTLTVTSSFNPALCCQKFEQLSGLPCLVHGHAFVFVCVSLSKVFADVAFFICKILSHCIPLNLCVYQVGPDGKTITNT